MQHNIDAFLQELQQNPDNLAIALFGSRAKGTHRPDSDIDLMVITKTTSKRAVIKRPEGTFEIVYATVPDTEEHYKKFPNKNVEFWQHAKILFDPDKILETFQKIAHTLAKEKRYPVSEETLKHALFNLSDQLGYIKFQADQDPASGILLLHHLLSQALEFYFDYHQLWKPAPKELLSTLDKINPALAQKARDLLLETNIHQKTIIFEKLVEELHIQNE